MSYAIQHLKETAEIVAKLDPVAIEKGAQELVGVRNRGGRLFILGVGGSATRARPATSTCVVRR
jgi:D-sedoheptulose 7-phosphate isomerase